MAKFLTGNELNLELEKIFEKAETFLILISPYIKLHNRYESALKSKIQNDKLQIFLVFGKNENNLSKSMSKDELHFFTEFPNIEIRYEKRLHAKYYANESTAILSSMNLYSYSQDNNIEAGVMTQYSRIGDIATKLWDGNESLDSQTTNYFDRVIEQSELIFKRTPNYESAMLGLSKKYIGSEIEVNRIDEFFKDKEKTVKKTESSKNTNSVTIKQKTKTGFCIRTGVEIPFNPKNPLSDDAYKSWVKFENKDFKEKYCHYSGEASNGETSYGKPILKKNWKKAMEHIRFDKI